MVSLISTYWLISYKYRSLQIVNKGEKIWRKEQLPGQVNLKVSFRLITSSKVLFARSRQTRNHRS